VPTLRPSDDNIIWESHGRQTASHGESDQPRRSRITRPTSRIFSMCGAASVTQPSERLRRTAAVERPRQQTHTAKRRTAPPSAPDQARHGSPRYVLHNIWRVMLRPNLCCGATKNRLATPPLASFLAHKQQLRRPSPRVIGHYGGVLAERLRDRGWLGRGLHLHIDLSVDVGRV
jgi:hypothetical protein